MFGKGLLKYPRHAYSFFRWSSTSISLPQTGTLPAVWLRDHCRCQECYDPRVKQRMAELPQGNMAEVVRHSVTSTGLTVRWADGHQSEYDLNWLLQLSMSNKVAEESADQHTKVERHLWDRSGLEREGGIPTVPYEGIMTSDTTECRRFYSSLLRYGFVTVNGTPLGRQAFEELCARLCLIQNSNFGPFGYTTAGQYDHADSAFGWGSIALHTDCTYRRHTPGVQIFTCIEESAPSETDLCVSYYVDGYYAAKRLNETDPAAFSLLSTLPVDHHYTDVDRGEFYNTAQPVLTLDGEGSVEQIRFNTLDRSTLPLRSCVDPSAFYAAFSALASLVNDEDAKFYTRLSPGLVMFVDNWRMLHARTAFRGHRVLGGSYFARDDLLSRARSYGVAL